MTQRTQASYIYVGVKNTQTIGIGNSLLGCLTEKFVVFIVVGNREDFLTQTWKPRIGSSHSVLILELITPARRHALVRTSVTVMSNLKAPAPHRRAGIPATSTPRPKPQLTIEEWEAKAPLSDLALKSVAVVKAASEKTPLPLKVQS